MKVRTPFIFLLCAWNCISTSYSQTDSLTRNQFNDGKVALITVEKPVKVELQSTLANASCFISYSPKEIVCFKIINLQNRNEPANYLNLLLSPTEILQINSMESTFLDLIVSSKQAFIGSENLMNYDLISVTNSVHVNNNMIEKNNSEWTSNSANLFPLDIHAPRFYLNLKLTVAQFSTNKFSVMRRAPFVLFVHYSEQFNTATSAGNVDLIDSTAILLYGKSIWLEYPDSWKNGKQRYARVLVEEHQDTLTREKYYRTITWEPYEPLIPEFIPLNYIRFY